MYDNVLKRFINMSVKRYPTLPPKLKKEIDIEYLRTSGPGGRKRDSTFSGVRIRHRPSGITVIASESRFQSVNKMMAYKRLVQRLKALTQRPKPRIPTHPSLTDRKKRIEQKKRQSMKKRLREKVNIDFFFNGW